MISCVTVKSQTPCDRLLSLDTCFPCAKDLWVVFDLLPPPLLLRFSFSKNFPPSTTCNFPSTSTSLSLSPSCIQPLFPPFLLVFPSLLTRSPAPFYHPPSSRALLTSKCQFRPPPPLLRSSKALSPAVTAPGTSANPTRTKSLATVFLLLGCLSPLP